MNGVRGEMNGLRSEIRALDEKTTVHITRLDERITLALDLRERIVAIEARLRS